MLQRIKSLDILSCVKIGGLVMSLFGFVLISAMVLAIVTASLLTGNTEPILVAGVILIVAPIFYGICGVLYGGIGAGLYNLTAMFLGGIEVDIREVDETAV